MSFIPLPHLGHIRVLLSEDFLEDWSSFQTSETSDYGAWHLPRRGCCFVFTVVFRPSRRLFRRSWIEARFESGCFFWSYEMAAACWQKRLGALKPFSLLCVNVVNVRYLLVLFRLSNLSLSLLPTDLSWAGIQSRASNCALIHLMIHSSLTLRKRVVLRILTIDYWNGCSHTSVSAVPRNWELGPELWKKFAPGRYFSTNSQLHELGRRVGEK